MQAVLSWSPNGGSWLQAFLAWSEETGDENCDSLPIMCSLFVNNVKYEKALFGGEGGVEKNHTLYAANSTYKDAERFWNGSVYETNSIT